MKYIEWSEVAQSLIVDQKWGREADSLQEFVRNAKFDELAVVLLFDIAKSLRFLRCSNFQDIPRELDVIRRNTGRISTKKKRIR